MESSAIRKIKMGANGLPAENIYGHTKKLRFITAQIDNYIARIGKPISLLDYGCGSGSAVSQFLIRDGIIFYGVDIHQESLAHARKYYSSEDAKFLDRVPKDVHFDVIVYADVIEHLDNPANTLSQHREQLKDYGIIIASVPNGFGPFETERRIDKWLQLSKALLLGVNIKRKLLHNQRPDEELIPYNYDSEHVQFFTKKTLLSALRESGFRIQTFRNGSFLGAPVSGFFLRGERIANLNAKVADFLPNWAVSTWYFTAMKTTSN